MDLGLRGKVALVAASSKGLGLATARELAAEGASLAMCARGEAALEAARRDIAKETGAAAIAIAADVSTTAGVEQVTRADRDVKVLYLTGYNEQLFREKASLWADEAYLDKPCTVKGLLEAVSLLLYGHLAPSERPAPSHEWLQ